MLIIKHGCQRKYAYGESGIFDTLGAIVFKIVANSAVQKVAMDAGIKALEFTDKKAVDLTGSQTKKLRTKFKQKKLNPISSAILQRLTNPLNPETLQKLTNTAEMSLNNLT